MKILLVLMSLISTSAFAIGGYDLTNGPFGSTTTGAESLLVNPAGLSTRQAYGYIFDMWGSTSSPVKEDSNTESDAAPVYSGGIFYSQPINERMTLGFGYYGLAGLENKYKGVNYGSVDPDLADYTKDFTGTLNIKEYSFGTSYKFSNNFRVGAAIRGQVVTGSFQETQILRDQASNGVIGATTASFNNLEGNKFGSYRVGFQYVATSQIFGFGVTYRSGTKMKLKGDVSGDTKYTSLGGSGTPFLDTMTGGPATVYGELPQKVDADGHLMLSEKTAILYGYAWTNYKRNKELGINATLTGVGGASAIPNTVQNWKNTQDYKIGVWTSEWEFASYRLGYQYSTSTTDSNAVSPTGSTPAGYHQFSLGATKQFTKSLSVDLGFDLYRSSGQDLLMIQIQELL